jgi:SRR1
MSNPPPGFPTPPSPSSKKKKKKKNKTNPPSTDSASNKRTIVALSDGWSLVTKKNARSNPSSSCAATSSAQDAAPADVSPTVVKKRMDLIRRCRAEYAGSAVAGAVRTHLRQALLDTRRQCDVAVLVGLGKLDTTDSDLRPVWQLVLFLDVVRYLVAEQTERRDDGSDPGISMYAQDPVFGPLETQILTSFGIEIVADPAARGLLSPSSLLFAPFVHWSTLLRSTLATSDPMLYLGANLSEVVELLEHHDRGYVGTLFPLLVCVCVCSYLLSQRVDSRSSDGRGMSATRCSFHRAPQRLAYSGVCSWAAGTAGTYDVLAGSIETDGRGS